jgi:hypothetical protein
MKKPLQNYSAHDIRSALTGGKPMVKQTTSQTSFSVDWKPPEKFRILSLKSIAEMLDTTRSSARRWLKEAGIRPVALSRGAKGAIRYKWKDIEAWLNSLEYVE